MTSSTAPASRGSRTAAYLVAWIVATIPVWLFLAIFLGPLAGLGGVVVLWSTGVMWLVKQRQDDPLWDKRLPGED